MCGFIVSKSEVILLSTLREIRRVVVFRHTSRLPIRRKFKLIFTPNRERDLFVDKGVSNGREELPGWKFSENV